MNKNLKCQKHNILGDVKQMKIDFYISSLSSGGAEHVLINLAANFANRGHDVGIISYEKRPHFYEVNQNVKVFKITEKNTIFEFYHDLKATKKQLKSRKAEVSISFLSRCNFMLILTGFFLETKIIVCDRNNLLKKYSKSFFTVSCLLYTFADAVCVQTNEMKSFYPKYLQKKIFVLENPLDFAEMQKQCYGREINKENIIISVGRLEKQKDYTTLIKAFSLIEQEFPDWKLYIFGQGNDREIIQRLINRLGLDSKVKLCGITHTPFLEMKKSKIFVLSSLFEGFPNVLCEAMYSGLPCIATKCECGPSELIHDGFNGFLVPIGDQDLMAKKIKLLIGNEELRNMMGKRAKESTNRLELGLVCDRWIGMINKVKKDIY